MLRVMILTAVCALTGCAGPGDRYEPQRVASVQPGMTETQVVRMLGPPSAASLSPDGGHVLVWTYAPASAAPPRTQAPSVTFTFDPGGRVLGPAAQAGGDLGS